MRAAAQALPPPLPLQDRPSRLRSLPPLHPPTHPPPWQAYRCKACGYTAERRRPECAAHPYAVQRVEVRRSLACGTWLAGVSLRRPGLAGQRASFPLAPLAAAASSPRPAAKHSCRPAGDQALVAVRRLQVPLFHGGGQAPHQALYQVSLGLLLCCMPDEIAQGLSAAAAVCLRARARLHMCTSHPPSSPKPATARQQVQRAGQLHRDFHAAPAQGARLPGAAGQPGGGGAAAGARQRAEVGQQLVMWGPRMPACLPACALVAHGWLAGVPAGVDSV